jgi:hypothetical protein
MKLGKYEDGRTTMPEVVGIFPEVPKGAAESAADVIFGESSE